MQQRLLIQWQQVHLRSKTVSPIRWLACYHPVMRAKELFINSVVMHNAMPAGLRSNVLRKLGMNLGPGTYLGSGTRMKGTRVKTGNDCFINHDCRIDRGQLTLGDRVYVGPNVSFITNDHKIGTTSKRAGDNVDRPIRVGDGSWIGANATILGGVSIAPGCIVAAGAVVVADTIPDGVYGGVPAKLLKVLD